MYLNYNPGMDVVSTVDVLSELDLTNQVGEPNIYKTKDYQISRTSYISDKYLITVFKTDRKPIIDTLADIYEAFQNAAPKFIKAIIHDETLITAIPNYEDITENATYSAVIDEMIRVSAFLFRKFGSNLASIYIKEYIDLNVSYPGNRSF